MGAREEWGYAIVDVDFGTITGRSFHGGRFWVVSDASDA